MNEKTERQDEDQAEELRRLIGDVQANEFQADETDQNKPEHNHSNPDSEEEIDILNLPPRKMVHQQKKTPVKLKIKRPLLRLLLVVIILIVILVLAWMYLDGTIMAAGPQSSEEGPSIWLDTHEFL
ncbi:hypothetical protein JNUCC1_03637 [Lentibacillus sp. JNUCC-1]|uniref:hypothetical protein n=1 Tax=Lentibacillus sp. JNUCC-1 TaxID=2654513 RepID=UPI0012E945A0|nr:hypothetical protein [Lentibacillus sp. JNUCC-1]MUV39753.1 hypothetical protein [Lentibacillus sp. JNUCC-1]